MAQPTNREPTSSNESMSSLPRIPETSEDAELKTLLIEASVNFLQFDYAPRSVKHAVLDCVDPERQRQPQWTKLPARYDSIAHLLLNTWPAQALTGNRSYDQMQKKYKSMDIARLETGSRNLENLLKRFCSYDIKDDQGNTAWDLALLEIKDFLAASGSSLRILDPTWKTFCFMKLELEDQHQNLPLSCNGQVLPWNDLFTKKFESFDWIALGSESQSVLDVIVSKVLRTTSHTMLNDYQYVMRAAVLHEPHYELKERNGTLERVLQSVVERKISHTGMVLYAREPSFVENTYVGRVGRDLVESFTWSLSMPYITTETYGQLHSQRSAAQSRQPKFCRPGSGHEGRKMHTQLTLDEYCKPFLGEGLRDRNTDQVLSKHEFRAIKRQQAESTESVNETGKIDKIGDDEAIRDMTRLITVGQAWMWLAHSFVFSVLDAQCVDVSQFLLWEPSEEYVLATQGDFRMESGEKKFYGIRMKIALILSTLIHMPSKASPSLFDAFEGAIMELSDDVSQYLRLPFQNPDQVRQHDQQPDQQKFDVNSFNVYTEAGFYRNIADVREELAMLRSVILQQENIWTETMKIVFPEHWKDDAFVNPFIPQWQRKLKKPSGADQNSTQQEQRQPFSDADHQEIWRLIERPQDDFARYKRRLTQLDESAARIEASIGIVLDLRAKHASMKEAHSTAAISVAVFGFTIVTVIFTPLSFMTSLFALPIKRFQENQSKSIWGGDSAPGVYDTHYIGTWISIAEVVTLVVTALATLITLRLWRNKSNHTPIPDQRVQIPQQSASKKEKWWARKRRNAQPESTEPHQQPDQRQQQRQNPADTGQNHATDEPASSSASPIARQRTQDLERQ